MTYRCNLNRALFGPAHNIGIPGSFSRGVIKVVVPRSLRTVVLCDQEPFKCDRYLQNLVIRFLQTHGCGSSSHLRIESRTITIILQIYGFYMWSTKLVLLDAYRATPSSPFLLSRSGIVQLKIECHRLPFTPTLTAPFPGRLECIHVMNVCSNIL